MFPLVFLSLAITPYRPHPGMDQFQQIPLEVELLALEVSGRREQDPELERPDDGQRYGIQEGPVSDIMLVLGEEVSEEHRQDKARLEQGHCDVDHPA